MEERKNLLATDQSCPPGTPLVVPEGDDAADAALLKAVADPTRLKILRILAANGEVCACDLEAPLGLSQPTVSHHLRQLVGAGVVTRDKRGTWAYYALDLEGLGRVASPIAAFTATSA